MSKSLIKTSFLGGVIAFFMITFLWRVLPFDNWNIHEFQNPKVVLDTVMHNAPEDGLYIIQGPDAITRTGEQGYLAVNVRKVLPFDVTTALLITLFLKIVGAFILCYLVLKGKITAYWDRVIFFTLAGVFIGVVGSLHEWTWMHFTNGFAFWQIFDRVASWFVAGLVMAKFLSKK